MAGQLLFSSPEPDGTGDLWCRNARLLAWDGVDFSGCFRRRVLNGYLSAIFLGASILCFLFVGAWKLYSRYVRSHASEPAVPLPRGSSRRLSTSRARSRSLSQSRQPLLSSSSDSTFAGGEECIEAHGPAAITEAENEVIMSVVAEESEDLTLSELLALGITGGGFNRGSKGRSMLAPPSPIAEDDSALEQEKKATPALLLRALAGTKKDLINVAGAAGILSFVALHFSEVRKANIEGSNWLILTLVAWAWTLVLVLVKLSLAYTAKLYRLRNPSAPHRLSPLYTMLERHFIPWLFVYTFIVLLDVRSAWLQTASHATPENHRFLRREITIAVLALLLSAVEWFSPRPSRFGSRKVKDAPAGSSPRSPEINASLFQLTVFSYLESFMFGHTFPKLSGYGPVNMKTVPELRPDDMTARTLLGYRKDTAWLNAATGYGKDGKKLKPWGLTGKLSWHFRSELAMMQFWTWLRLAFLGAPPLLMQQLLAYISERSEARKLGTEARPMHVGVFFAVAMFITQIITAMAASQALIIGRRVCLRMRSIIIGEVFTKALRRKDVAGSSNNEKANVPVEGEEAAEGKAPEPEKEEAESASSGKIMNLISVDTFRLSEVSAYLHYLWPETLMSIIIATVLLLNLLGVSALAGITALVCISPLQILDSRLYYVFEKRLLAAADKRINLATEVIGSVRIIKAFAWTVSFEAKMSEAREKELAALVLRSFTMVVSGILMFGAPVAVSVATFVFHTKVLHRPLSAEKAFTALALFTILRSPLEMFTDMLINVLQAHVSLKRIDAFLEEEETEKYTVVRPTANPGDPVIGFVNAAFTWSKVTPTTLGDSSIFKIRDLNLAFPPASLSLIVGPVGSGKTTLLMSLLGETNCLGGSAFLPSPVVRSSSDNPAILSDTTAYCAQTPWLLSATIKDNILFGSPMNTKRYSDVLDACALRPDLKVMDLGDLTEVGEKGTVLSGGQKARIALARALYSPAKHILLDDVLSAVDSHTGQHLYNSVLKGPLMRHRSCVLVTHAVDLCAPGAAFIVSMDNGAVVASGSPADLGDKLVTLKDEALKPLSSPIIEEVKIDSSIEAVAEPIPGDGTDPVAASQKTVDASKFKLVQDEVQMEGAVSYDVYRLYFKAMGGLWAIGTALCIFLAAQIVEILVSLALRYWAGSYDSLAHTQPAPSFFVHLHQAATESTSFRIAAMTTRHWSFKDVFDTKNTNPDYWLKVYCGIALLNLTMYGFRVGFFLLRGIAASRNIYRELMSRILGARMRFFDSTPTGRILNRLSKDIETIDQDVPSALMFLILEIFSAIGILGTLVISLPVFIPAAVVVCTLYWGVGVIYLASSRELKRTESTTRSPIFSLFGEVLNGVTSIRAYGDTARFSKQVFNALNTNNRPFFTLWQANRWLSARVDTAGAAITLLVCICVLYTRDIDAALAGFVLTFAMSFNERMLWLVRMWSQNEINMNSVERVREYLDLEQESVIGSTPPAIWPSRDATIHVEGLTARYAPELPPVLKNVSFTVLPREKVGICGRTGSGKSTLALSFFRFIEPDAGRIIIDGIDISSIQLADLRSRLTIVAQESALFAGTLRFNLDPFSSHEDEELWDVLRRTQLASSFTPRATPGPSRTGSVLGLSSMTDGASEVTAAEDREERFVVKSLDMEVSEGGKNFSAGQRQLLALARGMLKLQSSSILLLDESTASLDAATDDRIQRTIRSEMSNATILCIAHRLRTIIDYDKILVLGQGEVLEYAAPWDLLEKDSEFNKLCKRSGEYDALFKLAMEAKDRKARSV